MLIGYNTNVRHKGKTYHVQTEDSGLKNPVIVTLMYHQGAILLSKKTSYSELIGSPDFEEKLRELMKQQHKDMIRELIRSSRAEEGGAERAETKDEGPSASAHQEEAAAPPENSPAPGGKPFKKKSLDEILLEHISRKVKNG